MIALSEVEIEQVGGGIAVGAVVGGPLALGAARGVAMAWLEEKLWKEQWILA